MAATDFTKMVPGFDFLQGLMQNAGSGIPSMSQWIAPTLDPDEIEKRIGELKTVQFWLEQNARLLGATIQALEVQKMTLSTLKTMNLPLADLRESMKINLKPAPEPAPAPAPAASPAPEAAAEPAAPPSAGADPMLWWGALTKQFTDLAASALKEGGPARQLADAMVKGPAEALAKAIKPASATVAKPAKKPVRVAARKAAGPAARKTARS